MSATSSLSEHANASRDKIGLFGSINIIVGFVIGASIFILPGPVAGMVGPGLPLAYVLAVVPVILTCLYLIQLGSTLPVTGANYVVSTRFGSPLAGYLVVWLFIACGIFALPVMALGFASYLKTIIPNISILVTAIVLVVALGIVNFFSIKTVSAVQSAMTVIFMAALLIYIVGGVFHIDSALYENPFPNGAGGLLMGALTVYFSFTGLTVLSELSGEVRNPRKVIPLAVSLSLLIILVVYCGVGFIVTGTLDWTVAGESVAAVSESAATFYPEWMVAFISLGALFASATTINALYTAVARDVYRLGQDKIFPTWFSKVGRKSGVPYPGVLLMAVLAVLALLARLDISDYVVVVVFAFLVMQTIAAISVFRIRKLNPELWNKSPIKFSPVWAVFIQIALVVSSLGMFIVAAADMPRSIVVFAGIIVLGLLVWYSRAQVLKAQGIDLRETLQDLPEDFSSSQ